MPEAIKEGQLRVLWITNIPIGDCEYFYVNDIKEAKLVLATLSIHDLNLGDDVVDSNVGTLEVFEDGEWVEWEDDEDFEPVNTDEEFDMLKGLHLNLTAKEN